MYPPRPIILNFRVPIFGVDGGQSSADTPEQHNLQSSRPRSSPAPGAGRIAHRIFLNGFALRGVTDLTVIKLN